MIRELGVLLSRMMLDSTPTRLRCAHAGVRGAQTGMRGTQTGVHGAQTGMRCAHTGVRAAQLNERTKGHHCGKRLRSEADQCRWTYDSLQSR